MVPGTRVLSCLWALIVGVRSYAEPERCLGECFAHDPGLIRRSSDGVYFRFNTDTYIDIMKSDSLSGPWETVGNVLPQGTIVDLPNVTALWVCVTNTRFKAPMVIERDGTYILYYSVSTIGSQDSVIAYATSTTMEEWEDHGSTGVESTSADSYNAIDPTMILVDGTYHLSFGSFWGDIQLVTFNSDATAADGDPTQTIYEPEGNHDVEASFPFKYGDYFYMFWSQGQANDYDVSRPAEGGEYRIRACRSSDIGGPYTDEDGDSCLEGGGNDVLASHDDVYGPGGQGVFDDPEHGPILYYRYVNTSIGYAVSDYQWGWNVIDWVDGWPTV